MIRPDDIADIFQMESTGKKYPAFLGLGSNLGDRKARLVEALRRLDEALGTHWTAVSDFIETEPWGFESDEKFLNAVVRYDLAIGSGVTSEGDIEGTAESSAAVRDFAEGLLEICKGVERAMGRTDEPVFDGRGVRVYESRVIDIDILLLGDIKVDEPNLKIPHPLMNERDFVMKPLRQVAPEFSGR